MGKYGTLSALEDLAAVVDPLTETNEAAFADRVNRALSIYNAQFSEMVGEIATTTSQAMLAYGGFDSAIIDELDEWGSADASKAAGFGNLGLPLRIYGGTLQWTRTYLRRTGINVLAAQLDAFALADIQKFQRNVKVALFKPTNTVGYFDRLDTKLTYDLKALLNADGSSIPPSPSGATFDGATHTHYLGSSTLTAVHLQALIDTVVEHGVDGSIRLYIARANEATVRGLTGFTGYMDARVTVVGAAQIGTQALDVANPDNRAIGVFGGAEVWVKPWIPANYQAVIDTGSADKPLAVRTRTGTLTGDGGFGLVGESEQYPLRAQNVGREYGVGVVGRHKAAVGKSDNATYSAPTL